MNVIEFMGTRSPNPNYIAESADTTDAFVLAIDVNQTKDISTYVVANEGITEHAGSLNPETAESQYLHTGKRSGKSGNQRQFSLAGDCFSGDEFQNKILDFEMKFGTGNAIIRDYVYFNALTGLGEKGQLAIMVEDDTAGSAGENATFSATLYGQGKPSKFSYVEEIIPINP